MFPRLTTVLLAAASFLGSASPAGAQAAPSGEPPAAGAPAAGGPAAPAAPTVAPQTAGSLPPAPVFVVPDPAVVDLGSVYDGEPARSVVRFTNTSDVDRALAQVRTSCGCTVATVHGPDGAEIPARPINPAQPIVTLHPGQSITVDVEMLTANQHGAVEKLLQVFPADATLATVDVPVRARVSKAFSVSPESVNLGTRITKTGPVESIVVIQSEVEGDWTIDGFSSGLEGRSLPADLEFHVLDTTGAARRVQLLSPGPRAVGPLTLKVHVAIGHPRVKGTDFYVYGQVSSDVQFDTGNANFPNSINFEQMDAGSKVTRTLKITNADPTHPYLLDSVEVKIAKSEFFTTQLRTIEPGVAYELDVTADAGINEAFFTGYLVLHARHADVTEQRVQFHGWVRKG